MMATFTQTIVSIPGSEDALALSFTARFADELRFVAFWSRWLRFIGAIWQFEDTLEAFDLARAIVRENAVQMNGAAAPAAASSKIVASVERLARADRAHAETIHRWNQDQFFFSTRRS